MVSFASGYFATMSSLRRLKDANLKDNGVKFAVLGYLLIAVAMIFIPINFIDLLILIPATLSGLLMTYPSTKNHKYIWGYNGPVDLSHYDDVKPHHQHSRIEPSFTLNTTVNANIKNQTEHTDVAINSAYREDIYQTEQTDNTHHKLDLGEVIRNKLLSHTKIVVISILLLISIIIAINFMPTTSVTDESLTTSTIENKTIEKSDLLRNEKLEMPDNFTLFLTQYNGLIIHWQADKPSANQYWSLTKALGDESCQSITFNRGEKFRTLSVMVENTIDHYANFSPLDTQKLLQSIAFRGNFTLCGFKFSLKGSQATLNKNNHYAEQINY